MSLPVLPFAQAQHLLGVGVRQQRRPSVHLRHGDALARHADALARGARRFLEGDVEARLALLRGRLWRSPFYAEHLRAHGVGPDDLRSLADLAHFPLLDRAALGAAWEALPAFDVDLDHELSVAVSSGSTAQAIPVIKDGYDQLHMWAALRFWLGACGAALPPRPRVVLLCTLPGGLAYSSRLPHFERGALHRISTVRPAALAKLRRVQPAVLFSDPAGLHWLSSQPDLPRPALVLSSAQHLGAELRKQAQNALQAPVLNYYATTELGPVAWECLQMPGHFHVMHPDVWVESVGGELVVTRLRDSVLPLVRYRPGDPGEVSDGACACGFVGRTVTGFRGRRACDFVRPDGSTVDAWQLCWLFKDIALVGFQLVQEAPARFRLEVQAPVPIGEERFRTRLAYALERMGFPDPEVALVRVAAHEGPLKPEPFRTWLREGAAGP